MLQTLSKQMRKNRIIKLVIAVVVFAFCMAKFSILQFLMGPVELDITQDPAQYVGKWVTISVENVITDYVEHSTTTEYESGRTTTEVDGNSYIGFQSIEDYENMTAVWYFFSFYLPLSQQQAGYDMVDATWAYWQDESWTVEEPAPMKLTGTWEVLSGRMYNYYVETLTKDMGVTEDEGDIFLYYHLNTDSIFGTTRFGFYIALAVAALSLLFGIYEVVKMVTEGPEKILNQYFENHTEGNLAYLESDFAAATKMEKSPVWIGRKWTVYVAGPQLKIFANKDAVWAYYYKRTGRASVSQLRVFVQGDKIHGINLSEKRAKAGLEIYQASQPQMVIGYSKELEELYQKNYQEFLNLRYRPAMEQMTNDPFQEQL